ncbi:hypothetical protein [Sphingobacterium sp. 1.A.5]|jgi:hypothetical protein|uniref:hypothetical protein n=1 Tax=Sphingobacterium sp. 1.A.5 TaxID=2044604 RepID=UPI000C0BDDE7|nr:hypothetical protein [Sphingobacterium sp. 1.A.5]
MKTKLLLIFPILMMMLVGCEGLLDEIDDRDDEDPIEDPELFIGNWVAYEIYASSIEQNGVANPIDFSNVNLIKQSIKFDSYEAPCTTKASKVELKFNSLSLELKADKSAILKQNVLTKINGYDENCNPKVYDKSAETVSNQTWKENDVKRTLTLTHKESGDTEFKVLNISSNTLELEVNDGDDEKIKIILKK